MTEAHRRIELQSTDDLRYLIDNVRRAASARLKEDYPELPNGEDDTMRQRVEELVNEVSYHCYSNPFSSSHRLHLSVYPIMSYPMRHKAHCLPIQPTLTEPLH